MYTLNQEQIASVEGFIAKIGDSIVKSKYEKWLAEVRPTERVTAEQMEQFVALAGNLPKEVQNFPQSFSDAVKNLPETLKREAKEGTAQPANLTSLVNDSISEVADAPSSLENQEETLHKLGTLKGSKGGKKLSESVKGKKGSKSKATAKKAPTKKVREGAKLTPKKTVAKKVVRPVAPRIVRGAKKRK